MTWLPQNPLPLEALALHAINLLQAAAALSVRGCSLRFPQASPCVASPLAVRHHTWGHCCTLRVLVPQAGGLLFGSKSVSQRLQPALHIFGPHPLPAGLEHSLGTAALVPVHSAAAGCAADPGG